MRTIYIYTRVYTESLQLVHSALIGLRPIAAAAATVFVVSSPRKEGIMYKEGLEVDQRTLSAPVEINEPGKLKTVNRVERVADIL